MQLIHTAPIPGDTAELGLYQRGPDYFIKFVGGPELMGTRAHSSEDALGVIACRGLGGKPGVRVLIGGLGIGFTLAAALKKLDGDAEVVVAEIVPEVVEWNRDMLGEFAGWPLDDPRTKVETVDVSLLIQKDRAGFDAIMLDVDNGPDGLTRDANHWLYSKAGLARMLEVLRPGGTLAIWSEGPDRAFTKKLRASGFEVEEIKVRAHAGKGTRHLIWMAQRGQVSNPPGESKMTR
jgi:spermidine synthase